MPKVDFNVSIDTSEVKGLLGDLTLKLQTTKPLMEKIGYFVGGLISDSFTNERSPDGIPWEPLKPSTIANRVKKKQLPIQTLRASKEGIKAIDIKVFGDRVQVVYGGNNTGYMDYHVKGKRVPKRNFIPSEEQIENSREIEKIAEAYFNPSLARFVQGEIKRLPKLL